MTDAQRAWLDNLPVIVTVLRGDRVVYVNAAALAFSGRTRDSLLGMPFAQLVAEGDRARVVERHAQRLRGEPVPEAYEVRMLSADGPVACEVTIALDGDEALIVMRDLRTLAPRRERLISLSELGASLPAHQSSQRIFAALHAGLEALEVTSMILRERGEAFVVESIAGLSPGRGELAGAAARLVGQAGARAPLLVEALERGAAFGDDAARSAARFFSPDVALLVQRLVAESGQRRMLALRLDEPGAAPAVLLLLAAWFVAEDLAQARLFAAQVSASLSAARQIEALSRRNDELAAIDRLARLSGEATELPAFLEAAAAEMKTASRADRISIALLDEATGELVVVFPQVLSPGAEHFRRSELPDTPLGRAVAEGRRIVMTADDYPDAYREEYARLGYDAMVLVPLRSRSRVTGAVGLLYGDRGRLDVARLPVVDAMAAHLAAIIETQGLIAEERARVIELTFVNEVARLSATLDTRRLLDEAMRKTAGILGADVAAAYLVDEGQLTLATTFGLDQDQARRLAAVPAERTLAAQAVAAGVTLAAGVGDVEPSLGAVLRDAGMAHGLATPLAAKGQTLGAFSLGRRGAVPFGERERRIAALVATQLSVAVQNAGLFASTARRVRELEALNAFSRFLLAAGPGDPVALMRAGCEQIGRSLGASSVAVLLCDPDRRQVRGVARWGTPPNPSPIEDFVVEVVAGESLDRALNHREAVAIADIKRSPESATRERPHLLPQSALLVPLVSRGLAGGVLVVSGGSGRTWDAGELALAGTVASQLSLGVENARLYEEARQRVAEFGLVYEVGRKVAGSLDLQHVLDEGAESLRRTLAATNCFVLLIDRARDALVGVAGNAEVRAGVSDVVIPLAEERSLSVQVCREKRAIAVEDAENEPRVSRMLVRRYGQRSLLAVPLLLRDEAVGVIVIDETRRLRRFTPAEQERALAIGAQFAVAIDNARLYTEARRRADELKRLHEVGRSLVASLELAEVLDAGVKNLAGIVGAAEAYLLFPTASGSELEVRATTSSDPAAMAIRVPLDPKRSLAAHVFSTQRPLAVADTRLEPRIDRQFTTRFGHLSALGLPLVVRDRAIGCALVVDARVRRFDEGEIERATAIANQLAVAVENARLYEDLRKSYAELARAQARLVQRERLAALGELAAVVAHEVRNPLGVIFNSLGVLRRMARAAPDELAMLDILAEEADRLNRMVGELLDFARPPVPTLEPGSLERVLDEAIAAALAGARGGKIEVDRALDASLPPVPMDARLFRQALVNVALNAVQSMPKGGRLTVRASREIVGSAPVARIDVGDTGVGMGAEVRGRIFEPFFTTKATGTGLGLAVVKRIVEGHGGDVSVVSEPGQGTTFTIRMPLDDRA